MASSKTNDLLHCSICLEKFQQPRALPCLHTFCHLCLQEFIDTSARKGNLSSGFECPVCRRETLPDVKGGQDRGHHEQWAQLFPINHLIMTLLDEYKGPSTEVYDKHRPLGKSDKSSTVPGFVKDSEPIKNIPGGHEPPHKEETPIHTTKAPDEPANNVHMPPPPHHFGPHHPPPGDYPPPEDHIWPPFHPPRGRMRPHPPQHSGCGRGHHPHPHEHLGSHHGPPHPPPHHGPRHHHPHGHRGHRGGRCHGGRGRGRGEW
ncbi:uncharacterized protein LOC128217293 [Mya arenaria]|uniref:uncharacterized protein LOC128217293 n=1 Tax=Mya arenaria TaxID=6604 RepID=UPI0022DF6654|nr:uncharacterized protein LOC128217293 [Mya arenaria]